MEIVVGDNDGDIGIWNSTGGQVYAFTGITGASGWIRDIEISDLDNDGIDEMIVQKFYRTGQRVTSSNIYARKLNGSYVPGWNPLMSTYEEWNGRNITWDNPKIAVGDINNDGNIETVVSTGIRIYVYNASGSLLPGWPKTNEDWILGYGQPFLADIDNDGDLEIFVEETILKNSPRGILFYGNINAWHHTGENLTGWPVEEMAIWGGERMAMWDGTLVFGDIDGDGEIELIKEGAKINDVFNRVYVFDKSGNIKPGFPTEELPSSISGQTQTRGRESVMIADVNGDNKADILVPKWGWMIVYNWGTHSIDTLWQGGGTYAYDYQGQLIEGFPKRFVNSFQAVTANTNIKWFNDFDNDGKLEYFLSAENLVIRYLNDELMGSYNLSTLHWTELGHDGKETYCYSKPDEITRVTLITPESNYPSTINFKCKAEDYNSRVTGIELYLKSGSNWQKIASSNNYLLEYQTNLVEGDYEYNCLATNSLDNSKFAPQNISFTIQSDLPSCSDGTLYDSCSINKPEYCLAGILIENCSGCSCESGVCQLDESCIEECSSLTSAIDCNDNNETTSDNCVNGICINLEINPYCEDGICKGNETCETCPADCGECEEQNETQETIPSTPTASSGGGSGGGGGGGGSSNIRATYVVSEPQLESGFTKSLEEQDRFKFNLEGEHYLTLETIDINKIDIKITSNPIAATTLEGQTRKFDLNQDGYYDLQVKLNSISGAITKQADITIRKIYEPITAKSDALEKAYETQAEAQYEQERTSRLKIINWISVLITIGIIAIIGVLAYLIIKRGQIKKAIMEIKNG